MSSLALVFHKGPQDIKPVSLDLSTQLTSGETITGAAVGLISPSSVTASPITTDGVGVDFTVSGGLEGTTYGMRIDVTTSLSRIFNFTVAILVSSQVGVAYTVKNPDAVQTLLGEIYAGDSALARSVFSFPAAFDPAGGSITWTLLDSTGLEFSSGNAFEYIVNKTSGLARVEGRAVITVPSDVPVNVEGHAYQIRWELQHNGQSYFSFENLRVLARTSVPHGPEDVVEIRGDIATVGLVLPQAFDHVGVEVYTQAGSTLVVALSTNVEINKVPDGYYYTIGIDTTDLPVALENYVVMWKYWNDDRPSSKFRQTGRLFVVNPNILSVVDDVRMMVNRSRSVTSTDEVMFPVPYLLAFMRRGRDDFNGASGLLTNFDMTDATGSIRSFWLAYSELSALRSQFLVEGEKAFNFSGAAVSVDVDRTGYYEQAASAIQSRLDNDVKPFKQNLIKKGIISGTGNLDNIGMRRGAIGAVGITLSPAMNLGRYSRRGGY